MVDVCVVFTPFYCENRFRTPPWCASFLVSLLRLWDEKCFFRVPAIACSKSILIRPGHSKSIFLKQIQILKTHFARACAAAGHFSGMFWGAKWVPKVFETCTGSSEMLFAILYFLGEVDLAWPVSVEIDFGHEIPTTRKWSFSSQSLRSGTENGARSEGVRNRFSQ